MPSPQITFRLTEALSDYVEARTLGKSLTSVAKRDLERYYALIAEVTPKFEPREAALLYDALCTFHDDVSTIRYVWANVVEKIESLQLDEKWQVDAGNLVKRLRSLSMCERFALVDAVERAMIQCRGLDVDSEPAAWEAIRSVGLVSAGTRKPEPRAISVDTR